MTEVKGHRRKPQPAGVRPTLVGDKAFLRQPAIQKAYSLRILVHSALAVMQVRSAKETRQQGGNLCCPVCRAQAPDSGLLSSSSSQARDEEEIDACVAMGQR